MNGLSIEEINKKSAYLVCQNSGSIEFETEHGVVYRIDFMEDYSIWDEGAYQLIIINRNGKNSPNDIKIRETIFCILEEFFRCNPSILLYICETGDNRQAARSRLFLRWFKEYDGAKNYYLQEVSITSEAIENYAALILQKDNPHFESIVSDFNNAIELLQNKPEN